MAGELGDLLAKIVADAFQPVLRDVHMLKSTFSRTLKEGFVEEGDAERGYRINFGEDDQGKYLSAWLPHHETGKTSMPLKAKQRVLAIAPGGDLSRAMIIPGGYSDEHKSPNSDMEANVFKDAGVKVTVAGGSLKVEIGGMAATLSGEGLVLTVGGTNLTVSGEGVVLNAGGSSFSLTGAGFTQTGGMQMHDGKDVGATHTNLGLPVD